MKRITISTLLLVSAYVGVPTLAADTLSVQVYFRQGYSSLDTSYLNNGARLNDFANRIARIYRDSPSVAHIVKIRSSASPEGPSQLNRQLAAKRADVLRNYLERLMPSVSFSIEAKENDMLLLTDLIRRSDMPNKEEVLDILESSSSQSMMGSDIKRRLKKIDNGNTYRYMYRSFFPDMRMSVAEVYLPSSDEYLPTPPLCDEGEFDIPVNPLSSIDSGMKQAVVPPARLMRQRAIALRTNLLYDAFYMPNYGWAPSPNIQLEYFPRSGHLTYNLGFTWAYYHRWHKHKFFQLRDYNAEVRYYLNENTHFTGLFAGAYANANIYGFGLGKSKGWKGEGIGGGLTLGYVKPLGGVNSRWKIEFTVGAGMYYTKYDPYVYGNPNTGVEDGRYYYDYHGLKRLFKKRNHSRTWFGPTEAGIHISYDILHYRIARKGLGVSRWEVDNPDIKTIKINHK